MYHSRSLLIVVQIVEDTGIIFSQASSNTSYDEEKVYELEESKGLGFKYRRVIIVLCAIVGIALAVGLVVGLTRRASGQQDSSRYVEVANSGRYMIDAGHSTTSESPPQLIDNDTALAAAFFENGDRMVLFEDSSDRLRRLLYSESSREWLSASFLPLPTNVTLRTKTPMSIGVFGSSVRWPHLRMLSIVTL